MYRTVANRLARAPKLPRLSLPRATPINNRRVRVLTFATSVNWTVPDGVYSIQMAEGRGADGTPESGSHNYFNGYDKYRQRVYSINGGPPQTDPEQYVGRFSGSLPLGYCDPTTTTTEGGNTIQSNYCYRFENVEYDAGDYQPATTGASATGFGRSFDGGIGGKAPITRFYNIAVTPGQSILLSIPAGGAVTIYY